MYSPNNVNVYCAAFAGALSGLAAGPLASGLASIRSSDYSNPTQVAGAFAQAFDTEWGLAAITQLDVEQIQSNCEQAMANRQPDDAGQLLPSTWTDVVQSIIALVQEGDSYVDAQGITPPPAPVVVPFPWVIVDEFPGVDPTGISDSTAGIMLAYDALPASGGTMIFTDGSTYKVTNLVFTKPVQMDLGRSNLNQIVASTGVMIQTNSNIHITGQSQNEARINIASGCTGLKLASPWAEGGIGQYYGPSCVLDNIGFFNGLHHFDSTGLLGFYEGNLHVEECLFVQSTGLSCEVDDSVYYGFFTECHWFQCQEGLTIGTATETKLIHNIYVQAPGGGESLTLTGTAHVTLDREEFYGWIDVVNPDILIYALNNDADGIVDILDCKFGAELEMTFNKLRHRIVVNSPANPPNTTFSVRIKEGRFYAPGAMPVTAMSWTGGTATITFTPNDGVSSGLVIGDKIWILGDPVVAHSGYQGGPFTLTGVTDTTASWSHAGALTDYPVAEALMFPGSVSAIQIVTPTDRFTYSDNTFRGYPFAVDDSDDTTDGPRDGTSRCSWDETNKMWGPLGLACQEFVRGGRQHEVLRVRATSALWPFEQAPRINEMPEIRNRIEVSSEDFTKWGAVGSFTITAGVTDPFGTARATTIQRPGAAAIFGNTVWPAQAVNEGLTVATNATDLQVTGFLSFWAQVGGNNPCDTMMVCVVNNANGNMMLCQQVSLGTGWKRYRLPFIYDPTVTAPAIILCPGGVDAMIASVNVFGFQLDDYGGDYVPVIYTGSDASVYEPRTGNRTERDFAMAGVVVYEPNGDSAGITVTQVGTGLGTGATFTTTAVDGGMIIKCNTGTSPSSAGLIQVNFGRTLPGIPIVVPVCENGANGFWFNGATVLVLNKTTAGFELEWANAGGDITNASTADCVRFAIMIACIGGN